MHLTLALIYSVFADGARYVVHVSIYGSDGSVMVSHAGIESGQGINTKVSCFEYFELFSNYIKLNIEQQLRKTAK